MVIGLLSRRRVLTGMAALAACPGALKAEEIIDLEWEDLLPQGQTTVPTFLRGVIPHDENDLAASQPQSTGVRTDWNGRIVRLPGFIVPVDYKGTGVTAFILVPYVGACVHVPPPPANQLVFVTTADPYESKGLFEPVNVIGMFGTASTSTQLAEIGYALSAEKIEPFSG